MAKPVILPDYNKDVERDAIRAFNAQFFQQMDVSEVPGYSEVVRANDVAAVPDHIWYRQHLAPGDDGRPQDGITKEHVYKLIGANPRELKVRFMWLRVQDVNGKPSAQVANELMEYRRRGYREATFEEDLKNNGFGMPPAAYLAPDGGIRRDDVQLFVVDGRAAKAFDKALADYTQTLENPTFRSEDSVEIETETGVRSEELNV